MYSGPTSKSVCVTWIGKILGGTKRSLSNSRSSFPGRKIPRAEKERDRKVRSLARSALRDGKARSAPSSILLFSTFGLFSYISL
jgi:hypothetical protein